MYNKKFKNYTSSANSKHRHNTVWKDFKIIKIFLQGLPPYR